MACFRSCFWKFVLSTFSPNNPITRKFIHIVQPGAPIKAALAMLELAGELKMQCPWKKAWNCVI